MPLSRPVRRRPAARPGRPTRSALVVVTAGALTASALVAAAIPAAAAPATSPATSPVQRALRAANASGHPVRVEAATTATSVTDAQPDGTLTSTFNAVPVRVRKAGAWVPVDAGLVHNADGSYSPGASTNPVRVSGGGAGALAVMTNAETGSFETLSWPTPLPAPVVAGAVATYPQVLAGVDLQLTVSELGGVSEVLVVKDARAAANPALSRLRLASSATGMTLSSDRAGNITGKVGGTELLHAPTPLMWDSRTTDTAHHADAAVAPPIGARVAPLGVSVTGGAISLTPDRNVLAGAGTVYPVYLDPSIAWVPKNATKDGWDWAQEAFPDTSWWQDTSNGNPAVGYQGWTAGSYGRNRSFWQYDIGSLGYNSNIDINSATLSTTQTSSGDATCTNAYRIDAYNAGPLSTSSTWNHQPSVSSLLDYNSVKSCASVDTSFNVLAAVDGDTNGVVDFRLSAHDETSKWYYKRFTGSGTVLSINYDTRPSVPTYLAVSPAPQSPSGDCTVGGSSVGWVGATSTITLAATVNDPDLAATAQQVRARFHIWDKGGDGSAISPDVVASSDSTGWTAWTSTAKSMTKGFASSLFTDGHMYGLDAIGDDGDMTSGTSAHCYFWYDKSKPTIRPVTSADFSMTGSTAMVGQSGNFTLSASDVIPTNANYSGIDHFTYSTSSAAALASDGGTHKAATVSGANGTATISLTPTTWGVNYLYVAAVDNAGNESNTTTYEYYVRDNPAATVNPGDVDGDGRPDVLAGNTASTNLELYSTVPDAPYPATPVLASGAADSPDLTTWGNTLIAHRSSPFQSPSGARVDDLFALKGGTLLLYTNNLNNAGGLAGNGGYYYTRNNAIVVNRPVCTYDDTVCGLYAPDWTTTTQMIAPGDVDGDGLPDIIDVEAGALWLFHGSTTTGQLTDPRRIGISGWNTWRIMAPGDSTGDGVPDIWASDSRTSAQGGTGALRLYPVTRTCGAAGTACTVTVNSPVSNTARDWGADYFSVVTSPGDVDGDGMPDLTLVYSASTPDQLFDYHGSSLSATTFTFTAHRLVDDGSVHNWSAVSNLA